MTVTPADLTITPRDLRVDRNTRNARWWHGGDPIATAYFNALSAAFPQGETFFIESVRRYRDQVDEPLRDGVRAGLEAEHAVRENWRQGLEVRPALGYFGVEAIHRFDSEEAVVLLAVFRRPHLARDHVASA